MKNTDFKPSKALGQNFLSDANVSRKIIKLSGIDKSQGVLEVGPGFGALTVLLAEVAGNVTAVEFDRRLADHLHITLSEHKNVSIIQGDILKQNLKTLVSETLPQKDLAVCANLPYNITTPAITMFVEAGIFKKIIVMVQREVALRICAVPGSKDYGAFTIFSNYHTIPEKLFDVSPECFSPRPKVMSSVIKMTVRTEPFLPEEEERIFFKTVKAAFGQRRKTLVNALYAVFRDTCSKENITTAVKCCGFDMQIRGEQLSIDDFIKLSSKLNI